MCGETHLMFVEVLLVMKPSPIKQNLVQIAWFIYKTPKLTKNDAFTSLFERYKGYV